eukprot:scaffold59360_cov30-Phaeocystis_antarctica.AAC.1
MPLAYPNPPFSRCATCHGTKSAVYRRLYLRAMGQGRQLLICAIIASYMLVSFLATAGKNVGCSRGYAGRWRCATPEPALAFCGSGSLCVA